MKNSRIKQSICMLMAAAICMPTLAYEIYVTNEKDNSISVLSGESFEVTDTISVGARPRGIVLSDDGKLLYLCTSDEDHVEVLDLATKEVIFTLPSGPDPELMQLSPDGNYLYIANEDDNMVTVVDVNDRIAIKEIPVGIEPEGIGISKDGAFLVNTSETTNMAHFIDLKTLEIVDNVLVDQRPRVAQWTPDDTAVWVSSEIGGTVSIIDAVSREVTEKISFAIQGMRDELIQPVGIKIDSKGERAYVALGPSSRIAVVNAKTYEIEEYLLVGQRVWNLAFSPDERYLFSTNGVSGDVSIVDLEKMKVIKSVQVGRLPWGIVVSND